MTTLSQRLSHVCQTAKSAALVLFGVAGMARGQMTGQGCVLTFHGLRRDDLPAGVLDHSLHLEVSVFRGLCRHLSAGCRVMPLADMAAALAGGGKVPNGAVALTFDDGYASNFELAFPVLREFALPATIFLTTGFLDGTDPLWFQQVDRALGPGRVAELPGILARLKSLPDDEMRQEVARLEQASPPVRAEDIPPVMRPLTWDQAREMQNGGLVEFGGHTHRHPVLARCTSARQAEELRLCRERMTQELGRAPRLFAYPNGGAGDYTAETLRIVADAGFEHAWTMINGRLAGGEHPLELGRYGSPGSVWEAEATVSGAFELVKKWRGKGAAV